MKRWGCTFIPRHIPRSAFCRSSKPGGLFISPSLLTLSISSTTRWLWLTGDQVEPGGPDSRAWVRSLPESGKKTSAPGFSFTGRTRIWHERSLYKERVERFEFFMTHRTGLCSEDITADFSSNGLQPHQYLPMNSFFISLSWAYIC